MHAHFRDGKKFAKDYERSGCPITTRKNENVIRGKFVERKSMTDFSVDYRNS